MTKTFTLFVLILTAFSLTEGLVGQVQDVNKLDAQLTTTILNQQYCKNSGDVHSLFLKVRLSLVNKGTSPFLVSVPLGGVTIASNTLADAQAGRHEIEMNAPLMPIRSSRNANPTLKGQILALGQSVESTADNLQIFVPARPGAPPDDGVLQAGKHYLQIQIDVFPPGTTISDAISVVSRVMRDPVPFVVEQSQAVPDCSKLFKNNR